MTKSAAELQQKTIISEMCDSSNRAKQGKRHLSENKMCSSDIHRTWTTFTLTLGFVYLFNSRLRSRRGTDRETDRPDEMHNAASWMEQCIISNYIIYTHTLQHQLVRTSVAFINQFFYTQRLLSNVCPTIQQYFTHSSNKLYTTMAMMTATYSQVL